MKLFETGRKRARLTDDSVFAREISPTVFNLIQGGIVIIGLIINWIFLALIGDSIKDVNPIIVGFFYIAILVAGIVFMTEVPNTFLVCLAYYMVVAPFGIIIASVIDLASAKSGPDVVLQGVLIATCVTSAVTLFSCILPDRSDRFLVLAGIGGIGLAASIALIFAFDFEINIWAWLVAIFFCFCFVYDMAHSHEFSRTVKHAVDCAVDILLDVAFFIIRVPIVLFSMYIESYRWNN